jgi:uncharacterized protein YebE (UPF0316 family)
MEIYVILTALWIFFARVADVSFGTLRLISIVRDRPLESWLFGLLEVSIWLAASAHVLTSVFSDSFGFIYAAAYIFGFATGNIVGLFIERKLAIGFRAIQILTKNGEAISNYLDSKGLDFTTYPCHTKSGTLEGVNLVIKRRQVGEVLRDVKLLDPDILYMVGEIKEFHKTTNQLNSPARWRMLLKK